MLTQAQINAYNEKGYIAVENVLCKDELESLQSITDEYVELSRQVTESDDVFDLEPDHTTVSRKLHSAGRPPKNRSD